MHYQDFPIRHKLAAELSNDPAEAIEQPPGGYDGRRVYFRDAARQPAECYPRNTESVLNNQTIYSVIDQKVWDNITALQKEGAPDMLGQVISLYLEHSSKQLRVLHEAINTGDALAVQRAAHSLKSSSANLGAKMLSLFFKEVESLARCNSIDNAVKLISKIEKEYREVESALRTEMERRHNGRS